MCDIQALECESNGSLETSACHQLSAGNAVHVVPGRWRPADTAASADPPTSASGTMTTAEASTPTQVRRRRLMLTSSADRTPRLQHSPGTAAAAPEAATGERRPATARRHRRLGHRGARRAREGAQGVRQRPDVPACGAGVPEQCRGRDTTAGRAHRTDGCERLGPALRLMEDDGVREVAGEDVLPLLELQLAR